MYKFNAFQPFLLGFASGLESLGVFLSFSQMFLSLVFAEVKNGVKPQAQRAQRSDQRRHVWGPNDDIALTAIERWRPNVLPTVNQLMLIKVFINEFYYVYYL